MSIFSQCLSFFVLCEVLCELGHVASSQVLHIRGVPLSKQSLYSPDNDFQCLDGSLLIPFTHVNDDYCDCADGSDEPGTSACTNGLFFCKNTGHRAAYIPSTWVNDGVCDCCDASDEYASNKQCVDNCRELGREAWLEAQKAAELLKEGHKIRLEMIARGKQIKIEHQSQLSKLRADCEEAERYKKEKEALKKQAEERESVALERYKVLENEQSTTAAEGEEEEEEEEEELQAIEAEEYFKMIDSDSSGTVTVLELQSKAVFDKNKDGVVTEEEALFFLNNKNEITLKEFLETSWPNVKPFLMLDQGLFKPADQKEDTEEQEHSKDSIDRNEEENESSYDAEDNDKQPELAEHTEQETGVKYDEETQALIDEASAAREAYQKLDKTVNDLQLEIRRLEEKIDRDYGTDEEFASLDGECFEYTDLEYIYSLCMFGRASQKSNSGGSDVTLGHWYDWIGPEGNRYSQMKYDRGVTCWNGPARSVIVNLVCGKENKLMSVTEPSRCEYAMEFASPTLCKPSKESTDTHDEL